MNIRARLLWTLPVTILVSGCSQDVAVAKRRHYHLGMALARKGDDAKARRTLQRALQLDPKFPEAAQARKTLASLVY